MQYEIPLKYERTEAWIYVIESSEINHALKRGMLPITSHTNEQ